MSAPRAPLSCLTLALALLGCGASVTAASDAAAREDASDVDASREDVQREDVQREDVQREDVQREDVPASCARTERVADPRRATDCTAERLPVDAASLCDDPTRCPVRALVALRCVAGSGYGPWIAARGADTAVLFVTNVNGFVPRLFSIPAEGGPEVSAIPSVQVASTVLRSDPRGALHLVSGEQRGVEDLSQSASAWSVDAIAPTPPRGGLFPTDARFSEQGAHVVWFNYDDHSATLASRTGDCWTTRPIDERSSTDLALSLDPEGRPWTTYYSVSGAVASLRTRDPAGVTHTIWRGDASSAGIGLRTMPRAVAGGASGSGRWPAAIVADAAGPQLRLRDDGADDWRSVALPHAEPAGTTGDCPASDPTSPGTDPCAGRTACTERVRGSAGMFALTGDPSGARWAIWTQRDVQVEHRLSSQCSGGGPGPDAGGPPRCVCSRSRVSSRGELALWYGRVTDTGVTAPQRLRFATDLDTAPHFDVIAREGRLRMVVPAPREGGLSLRYLEVAVAP